MRRAACFAVLALLAAACSSGSGGSDSHSTLATALRQVANTTATRDYVEFGRPAAAAAANGGTSRSGPYAAALSWGASELAAAGPQIEGSIGFDARSALYAIGAGEPPERGVLLSGVAGPETTTKLVALGARRTTTGGGTVYRFRPDNQISVSDRLAHALPGLTSQLDVVRIDGSDLRFGASTRAVDATRTSPPGLLGYRPFADLARCLGDPLAAVLTGRSRASEAGAQAIGVGLSGAQGKTPTEQMCVAADSSRHAAAIADAVRKAVRNQPWSALLAQPSVSVHGDTVALTAHPAHNKGGVLLQALVREDLPGLTG